MRAYVLLIKRKTVLQVTFSMCSNFVVIHSRRFILAECVAIAMRMLRIV